jgi:metallo-beta-lactamase family protein
MATVEFLGATGTVTGSKFLVETRAGRLLVDCGLYQGLKALRLRNWERLPVDPSSIDWVVLTHGHIDHTGYLPRLVKDGFRGRVYATRATADLLRILLPDSGHLQEEEAAYHNKRGTSKHRPALPLYTAEEGLAAAERVETIHGLSAHADADGLLRWLHTAARPPQRVFVVHGDPEPAAALAVRIRKDLGWKAHVPEYRDRVKLDGAETATWPR